MNHLKMQPTNKMVNFNQISGGIEVKSPYRLMVISLKILIGFGIALVLIDSVYGREQYDMNLHGTQYNAGDNGKLFLQLFDSQNVPKNDSICYVSLYYPIGGPDDKYFSNQEMVYKDEGLYFYDFTVPFRNGIYMASAYCIVNTTNVEENTTTEDFETGTISGGSGWTTDWTLNGGTIDTGEAYEGDYSIEVTTTTDTPERDFYFCPFAMQITVDFWWWADSMETGEFYYVYIDDASGESYEALEATSDFDDNVWRETSITFNKEEDNFNFSDNMTFRIEPVGTDTADYFRVDNIKITGRCAIPANQSEYQTIRGSGEVQVKNDKLYEKEFTKGELYNDTFFQKFHMHYNIISRTAQNVSNVDITAKTYYGFPCRYVDDVKLYDENHTFLQNLTPFRKEEAGSNECEVTFSLDLSPDGEYDVAIVARNFWKQQILSEYQDAVITKDYLDIACINYQKANNLSNYTVPLEEVPEFEGEFHRACYSFYNVFYEYNISLNDTFLPLLFIERNLTKTEMDSLEADLIHLERIGEATRKYGDTIIQGLNLGNSYSHAILNDPYLPENPDYTKYFANISSANFNYAQILNSSLTTKNLFGSLNDTMESQHNETKIFLEDINQTSDVVKSNTNNSLKILRGLEDSITIEITDVHRVVATERYETEVVFKKPSGEHITPSSPPRINITDSLNNTIVDGANMSEKRNGVYSYTYKTTSSSNTGGWVAEVETEYDGNTIYTYDRFNLISNPAFIKVETYNYCPGIDEVCAEITIENEGTTAYEYTYFFWTTPNKLDDYSDSSVVDSGQESKLIMGGDTYQTEKCLTAPSIVGAKYFRAKVFFGEYSYATDTFDERTGCENSGYLTTTGMVSTGQPTDTIEGEKIGCCNIQGNLTLTIVLLSITVLLLSIVVFARKKSREYNQ